MDSAHVAFATPGSGHGAARRCAPVRRWRSVWLLRSLAWMSGVRAHLKQKALTMATTSIRMLFARAAVCCALLLVWAGPGWAANPAAPAPTQAPSDAPAAAPAAAPGGDFKSLDGEVQGLRKEVLDLNRDLYLLEEELLFPADTQVAVFLSLDVGTFFELDSVQLKLDNKEVANYLYTDREVEALNRGGVHRVFIGNLKTGKHELVAFFTGKGPHERDYKRGANLSFEKGVGAKYLELRISDRQSLQQPEFTVKEWE